MLDDELKLKLNWKESERETLRRKHLGCIIKDDERESVFLTEYEDYEDDSQYETKYGELSFDYHMNYPSVQVFTSENSMEAVGYQTAKATTVGSYEAEKMTMIEELEAIIFRKKRIDYKLRKRQMF